MWKLVVFARSDLESLTPGKLAAQVSHAASQHAIRMMQVSEASKQALFTWTDKGNEHLAGRGDFRAFDFGTAIVLDGGTFYPTIPDDVRNAMDDADYSGIVRDPTYPLRDGKVTHYLDLETCAWIFFDDAEPHHYELNQFVKKNFKLYSGNHD